MGRKLLLTSVVLAFPRGTVMQISFALLASVFFSCYMRSSSPSRALPTMSCRPLHSVARLGLFCGPGAARHVRRPGQRGHWAIALGSARPSHAAR